MLPASLALGVLGAAVLGAAVVPGAHAPTTDAALTSPLPDATFPARAPERPREAITDLDLC